MKKIVLKYLFLGTFLIYGHFSFSQCGVNAGVDQTITCGGAVQLNADPQWIDLNITGSSYTNVWSVYFTDINTGYAVADHHTIVKTSDGGITWSIVYQTLNNSNMLWDIYFPSANTGYAVGWEGSGGVFLKTTNGGINWTFSILNFDIKSVYFTDVNIGYIVGSGGTIRKTIDGGINWTTQISGTSVSLGSVYFTDANTGFAIGGEGTGSIILKTTNGGTNWAIQYSDPITQLWRLQFPNSNTGYAAGYKWGVGGVILKTTNGGNTWTTLNTGLQEWLYGVYFTDIDFGYVVGSNSTILKTANGGGTWQLQSLVSSTPNINILAINFPDSNTGFIIGGKPNYTPFFGKLSLSNNSFSWAPSTGLNASNIPNPIASPIIPTTYTVTMTTVNNCIAADNVSVNVNPLIVDAGNNHSATCGSSVLLNATTNYTGTGSLAYSWSPATGLNNTSIPNPIATVTENITYTVTVTTPNGCSASDNVTLSLIPLNTPEICIVTVDSITGKNEIVWEKPTSSSIDHYNVYKEGNQANVYNLIGSVLYDSLSKFIDTSSNPLQQANRYKISIFDFCNAETARSPHNMTIHLNINSGVGNSYNLIWNSYEGFSFPSYNIYRGTTAANMTLLSTVPSTLNSYTDLNPPSGYVYYQIEVVKPIPCSISKSLIISSRSNISTNNPSTNVNYYSQNPSEVQLYPNPFDNELKIVIKNTSFGLKEITIIDLLGKEWIKISTHLNSFTIDSKELPVGIYFLKIQTITHSSVKKVIKN
jgi:photosystem II stability/assembly factor-like uncharacterized protein